MSHVPEYDAKFLMSLGAIDAEHAEQVHGSGCPHCGGALDRADYGRVRHDGDAVAELAERLLRRARALDDVIGRYRQAVANAQRPDNDDDLPF